MRTAGVKAAVAARGGVAALVGLIARRPADDRVAESKTIAEMIFRAVNHPRWRPPIVLLSVRENL